MVIFSYICKQHEPVIHNFRKPFIGNRIDLPVCKMKMSNNSAVSDLSHDLSKEMVVENGKTKLRKWLNMNFRIEMTDGRILIGVFLCTDRDANVILGACSEYGKNSEGETEETRVLGLVMVPGRHIVSLKLDDTQPKYYYDE